MPAPDLSVHQTFLFCRPVAGVPASSLSTIITSPCPPSRARAIATWPTRRRIRAKNRGPVLPVRPPPPGRPRPEQRTFNELAHGRRGVTTSRSRADGPTPLKKTKCSPFAQISARSLLAVPPARFSGPVPESPQRPAIKISHLSASRPPRFAGKLPRTPPKGRPAHHMLSGPLLASPRRILIPPC